MSPRRREPDLARIALLALDVDGVLTDGRVLLGADGLERKFFSLVDGHGIGMLRESGVEIVFITREATGIAAVRASKLRVRCEEGVLAKGAMIKRLRQELGLERAQVAYAGDDLPDLEAFAEAGVRISVPNARDEVKRAADWVTRSAGGAGAVREICDRLLAARQRKR